MEFSAVDVVALIIVLVLGVRCAFRGFVAELMAFAAILLGLVAAVVFGGLVVPFAQRYIGDGFWTPIASFLAVFLVTYIVVKLFEGALYRLIDRVNLEKWTRPSAFFSVLWKVSCFLLSFCFSFGFSRFSTRNLCYPEVFWSPFSKS